MSATNFHEFEVAFPLLAMACKLCDYDGGADTDDLFAIQIGTAIDRRFAEAEAELEMLTARMLLAVVETAPGAEHPAAPIACHVLSSIFE